MFDAHGRALEVSLILGIAESLREEFGSSIDAHPGGVGSEAGVVNRAFRATTHRILKTVAPSLGDLRSVVACVLRRAALGRLGEIGVEDRRIEILLDAEPELGDAWLAYLALAPVSVIEDLLGEGGRAG